MSLHVDDLLVVGGEIFEREIMAKIRKAFQVGSEDKNDCVFVGQRTQWKTDEKQGPYINVHQNVAIDELQEITFEKHLKDEVPRNPSMHTAYRSVLCIGYSREPNFILGTSFLDAHLRRQRRPSAMCVPSTRPSRTIKSIPLSMRLWPLEGNTRLIGYPDAS